MFGRSKTLNEEQAEAVSTVSTPEREGAKNRPTPKRKAQEAARKRPLVETDRKAARDRDKEKRKEQQLKMRQAMATGDETYLPARDKGPVKRYIRNFVDARWNLGEFLLPVMLVVLALSFFRTAWALNLTVFLTYGLILLAVVDSVITWRRLKKKLLAKFGDDTPTRGLAMYAVMRSFQLRPSRMPKPQVARGAFPD